MNLSWTLPWTLHLGAAFYAINLAVGLSAQLFHASFGAFHHWLYAVVFAAAPMSKPGTPKHPALALIGALGYLAAYLL